MSTKKPQGETMSVKVKFKDGSIVEYPTAISTDAGTVEEKAALVLFDKSGDEVAAVAAADIDEVSR
jgi:hypothetical protein